ncbi:hypothetical protein ACCAA_560025 [Candidatus Accumulibacter aalborgensis]|uniref:Uncharacterized protein n=1 Tax=Candidatus Accumulibacter aalborgensis TaxID=1860102 RepID=A0A1A8XUB5_9PROT|nr:hypothetical protein [Candidatus Accumulibacter aalborgensis]SBT08326.1 hypothetical protein ACCAA_560025 [Candidatus Accumulibacter aalborgensis]
MFTVNDTGRLVPPVVELNRQAFAAGRAAAEQAARAAADAA